jgi:hypothetical protein
LGDPHTLYTRTLWGTFAQLPAQPVREGTRYIATDQSFTEYVSTGSLWAVSNSAQNALARTSTQQNEYVNQFTPTDANVPPRSYPEGVSRSYFPNAMAGWPGAWANILTIRYGTDVRQIGWDITNGTVRSRWAASASNTWSAWQTDSEDTGWQNVNGGINFQGTWQQYAGQTALGSEWTCRYRRKNGIVYMEGLTRSTTTAYTNPILTLPAGYRPGTGTTMRLATAENGYVRLDLQNNGAINLVEVRTGSITGWVSLSCNFVVEG